jgi:hypothetical protein
MPTAGHWGYTGPRGKLRSLVEGIVCRSRVTRGLYFDERKTARVDEAVLPWLSEHRGQPFFLWLHYFDSHQPLEPPPPYDQLYVNRSLSVFATRVFVCEHPARSAASAIR